MKELFQQYFVNLYKDIPVEVYEGLLAVFCICTVVSLVTLGIKKGLRLSAGLFLIEYIVLLFCSTVFFRQSAESRGHNFLPFWSYTAIQEGRAELLPENIMNVVVFIPIGILLGFMVQGHKMVHGEGFVKNVS